MPQGAILTNVGLSKIASATPLDQLNVVQLAVGDGAGGYPALTPDMTGLVNEVWRGSASNPIRDPNNPNILIFEAAIPASSGPFTIREQAIFDDAGDMVAIGQTSVVEKPDPNEAVGVVATMRLHVALSNAEQVDLFYTDTAATHHNSLTNRDDPGAHPASAISTEQGATVQDKVDDINTKSLKQGQTLQEFIDEIGVGFDEGIIKNDIVNLTQVTISDSTKISGGIKNKGKKTTLTFINGQSGISVNKTFVAGVDENIIGVEINELAIISDGQNKIAGTSGVTLNRVNKQGKLKNLEIRGFDKGCKLSGVIGGALEDINATNNTYGLYTESSEDPGLAVYDSTNTNVFGGEFNNNDYGAWLDRVTQGFNFYGTNLERNTVAGLVINATPPASSVFNFYGAWFEGNPIATIYKEKVKTVSYFGCYFFENDELFSNDVSGFIEAKYVNCKIDGSHINLDIFRGVFAGNDCTNCTFTATSPEAYRKAEWSGTPVSVDDGNTLLLVKSIGSGRYEVSAIGANSLPIDLSDGSKWNDVQSGKSYIKVNNVWQRIDAYIFNDRVIDFAPISSITSGGSAVFGPVTVTGASVGDFVEVTSSGNMLGLLFQAYVSASNQVSGVVYNLTNSTVDLPSQSYRIKVQKI